MVAVWPSVFRIVVGLFWLYFASQKWQGVGWMKPLIQSTARANPIPGLHELLVSVVAPNWQLFALAQAVGETVAAIALILGLATRWAGVLGLLLAANLALTVAFATGVLGKLYSELLESVDQRAVEAVRATGAREITVTMLARLPLALPVLLSYTLFRWECNLRAATVLGLVGAGGIGTELILAFRLFRYHELLTLVVAVLALVALIDVAGQVIRAQLLDAPAARACLPE